MKTLGLISIIFAMAFGLQAQTAVGPHTDYVLCKNKKIVRSIRVINGNSGCLTEYTKAGIDRIVGSGKFLRSCKAVFNNIRGNLEEAHWKCSDVSNRASVDSNRY